MIVSTTGAGTAWPTLAWRAPGATTADASGCRAPVPGATAEDATRNGAETARISGGRREDTG